MDVERRRAYYAASYHFVKYLVESRGMPLFLKLYESSDPEAEMPALYGAAREVLVRRALEAR
jgi:hypothetical protein